MKRYRPSSCNWMEDGVMLERNLGEYVKHEDVVKMVLDMMYEDNPSRENVEYRIEIAGDE